MLMKLTLASISSNFGEKQMAKSTKSPANSSKLFLVYSKNFVQILYENVLWNGFFVIHTKKPRFVQKLHVKSLWNWHLVSFRWEFRPSPPEKFWLFDPTKFPPPARPRCWSLWLSSPSWRRRWGRPGRKVIKRSSPSLTTVQNKVESLSLPNFYRLVWYLQARSWANPYSGALFGCTSGLSSSD